MHSLLLSLRLPGIKSTHVITWHRTDDVPDIDPDFPERIVNGRIINHIFPEIEDFSEGVLVSPEAFECEEYPPNYVGGGYKDWEYQEPSADYIKGQVNRRQTWKNKVAESTVQSDI